MKKFCPLKDQHFDSFKRGKNVLKDFFTKLYQLPKWSRGLLSIFILSKKEKMFTKNFTKPYQHTSYLSFLLHRQDFRKPNFTPKKTTKGTKNTKNVSEKVKYMHFFHSIWKNLHLTENFYTDMSVVSVTNKRYGCNYY